MISNRTSPLRKATIVIWCLAFVVTFILTQTWNTYAKETVRLEAEMAFSVVNPAVFHLRAIGEYGNVRSSGTGVLIDKDGLAVTAHHVIDRAYRLEADLPDGQRIHDLQVISTDAASDIAILQFPAPAQGTSYPSIDLRKNGVSYGEKVYAFGYPLKESIIITEGIINSPAAEVNGRNRVLTSAQIVSGMSGGPIIDRYGQLAGIISGSLRTMNGIHLVVPIDDIRAALE